MKFQSRFLCLMTALACVLGMGLGVRAAEVDCDSVYCFSDADFQMQEPVVGICITDLPQAQTGTIMLGSRVIRPGDILTAEQLTQMTFSPLWTEEGQDAMITYLPIYEDHVAGEATMTISIRGKQDKEPVAEDSALETYRNLPNDGVLKASDPEGKALTFTVTRQPKRGTVEIREDGSFTYTPKKNKVGVDSFTYTAADPAGKVSREATVTIQILKPTEDTQYTDTVGSECRFTAEWMKNTGIFAGEQVGSDRCFGPEKTVTRGEFLAMTMRALEIPVEESAAYTGFGDDCADWLKPYLAAAMRSGIVRGYSSEEGPVFKPDQAITGAEAAAVLRNALDLPAAVISEDIDQPAWQVIALTTVADSGITLTDSETVTRSETANALYQAVQVAQKQQEVLQ